MAKGYHQQTKENPFAGGPKPTVWPFGVGGRGNMSNVQVPKIIKTPTREMARTYVLVKTGKLTIDEALKVIEEIMVKDLENK